jgi:hypothetical protein
MLEKTIQDNIISYLQHMTSCDAENVYGNSFSAGRPDINACYKGRLLRIEVKTPDHGNTPSDIQKANLKRWAKSGAVCFVAYSLEEVKCVVTPERLLCDCENGCSICPVKKRYCYSRKDLKAAASTASSSVLKEAT